MARFLVLNKPWKEARKMEGFKQKKGFKQKQGFKNMLLTKYFAQGLA